MNTPDLPFNEWESLVRGRVRAYGEVALYGRVIVCERGYKAEKAVIQGTVLIDAQCSGGFCIQPVTRIILDGIEFPGLCDIHKTAHEGATVEAATWIREAVRSLDMKYPGVDFVSFIGKEV